MAIRHDEHVIWSYDEDDSADRHRKCVQQNVLHACHRHLLHDGHDDCYDLRVSPELFQCVLVVRMH